ncbi:hypothetical protein JHK87_031653 [Glycine soja]|nr:hypothetical protein JHK87_031653 [Glycine soja]
MGCVSVSSPENQNYMSSANEPAINREALQLDDRTLQNLVLLEIQQLLQANQRSLRDYPSMPYPEDANCPTYLDNSLILAELNYNNEELRSEFEHLFSHMTEIPGFYQRQWLPNYPKIVEFKYDGETYKIQVRQQKDKLYFADGLTRFRTELQIYESVMINFLTCDHPAKIDLHFTPPLDQQKCKRRRATRKHI